MRAALHPVVGRCTITAVEFRRTIHAFKDGVSEIKLGSRAAGATFRVNLDAIWPAPSDPQRSGFSLRKNPGMLPFTRLMISAEPSSWPAFVDTQLQRAAAWMRILYVHSFF